MRLAIVGSRDYADLEDVATYVKGLRPGTVVVSGGARGVDITAQRAAEEVGLETAIHLPKAAGPMARNRTIVADCDELIAFWNGTSNGTYNALLLAYREKKVVQVVIHCPEGLAKAEERLRLARQAGEAYYARVKAKGLMR